MDRDRSEIFGPFIPPKLSKLFELNFPPLLKTVKTLLNTWHTGLHLWFGHCSILKMSILPKFLYLFQALPISIPASYFRLMHSLFIEFIWANKRPHLNRKLLSLPKQHRGLAMPDIRTYYHATHSGRLVDWCRNRDNKLWPRLEQAQSGIPLRWEPWCYASLPSNLKKHPLIVPTTRICAQLFTKASLTSRNLPLFPILGDPLITPGLHDVVFQNLISSDHFQTSHFRTAGRWMAYGPHGSSPAGFLESISATSFLEIYITSQQP